MSRNVLATERLCNYNVINIDGFVKSLFCSMEFSKDFFRVRQHSKYSILNPGLAQGLNGYQ